MGRDIGCWGCMADEAVDPGLLSFVTIPGTWARSRTKATFRFHVDYQRRCGFDCREFEVIVSYI
jgi:hypothetical protein